jgi:ribosome-associated toxin RatA of RatAB toxin-antitoxin module
MPKQIFTEPAVDDATDEALPVEVKIEIVGERQRQISALIKIDHHHEKVWQVLTDYPALADFVPNLAVSRLLQHPTGGVRLEQIGSQKLLTFNFKARVVLDLEEHYPEKIHFRLVEGDLKDYSGSWQLEPSPDDENSTLLHYSVRVWPPRTLPVGMIERRLAKDLQLNLLSIRQRVEDLFKI